MKKATRKPVKVARCQKMQTDVDLREPECRHPDSYCKFRESCIIWRILSEEE